MNQLRQKTRAGFTLVELMIALVAGAFAVAGVYYLNGVSSRSFAEQLRVSETQMSLRSAMEQLRRDFSRAGYLAVPNSNIAPDCGGVAGGTDVAPSRVVGINILRDGSLSGEVSTMLGTPSINQTRADQVDVWGNYSTPEVYLVDGDRSDVNTIYFQTGSEAFRRSFFDPTASNGTATYNPARFLAAFPKDRMIRVENDGHVFFRRIGTVNETNVLNVNIVLSTPLPFCYAPGNWSGVAPISHLRYALESDAEADFARLRTAETAKGLASKSVPGSRRTLLVRREISDVDGSRVANTARLVLDYAVEFGVDQWTNTAATLATDRPSYVFTRSLTTGVTNPERIRSLIVTLTARSSNADPRLPVMGTRSPFSVVNTFDAPLRLFRVIDPANTGLVMNARTRTLRSEIMLQNF